MMEAGKLPEGWVWASIDDLVGSRGLFRDGDWVEPRLSISRFLRF